MTIDERIEALVLSVGLISHDVEALRKVAEQDGEYIRALARIAEGGSHA